MRRERVFRDTSNPFEWPEEIFIRNYRLPRPSVFQLCDKLRNELTHSTKRNHALTVEMQVLIVLRFLGTGSFQAVTGGDELHGVHKSTVSRCISRFCDSLLKYLPEYIQFPECQREIQNCKEDFYKIARFPNVVGAIDCTHISIKKPNDENAYVFLNRKRYYSINVQLVCDASLKILDVVARWPGGCHDSHIWSMSCLREKFINNENLKECWLLGDNGYPLEPWLLVPVLEPCSVSEENYNCSHRHTRGVIERCNGVLKSRFRCLDHSGGILLYNPEKVCKIIATTCILHMYFMENACSRYTSI